ncbi:N-acetyltransferase [Amycolatopsis sp. YIM 10]|uniref:GNAT family N-acetyltransferase n=1 Tax=Amycolatopsis sp. YIM 10 TaxID=2653857 RepID=UPI001290500F|nr:GNAT family N-acetyltransferase [Amycolatopsis sp. YIM 10]QFU92173.1 putative acetyltransferase [Amycolatopsis sp. YIM 10]
MTVGVRQAAEAELGALEPLWVALTEHHRSLVGETLPVRGNITSWSVRREQYRSWLREDRALIFTAHQGEQDAPAGYLCCRLLPSGATFDFGELRGEVDSLVVDPAVRGDGIGTALLEACRAELKNRGIEYWSIGVLAANTGAASLYERLGFRPWISDLLGRT